MCNGIPLSLNSNARDFKPSKSRKMTPSSGFSRHTRRVGGVWTSVSGMTEERIWAGMRCDDGVIGDLYGDDGDNDPS